jgi:methionyl-tRNA synthetase
VFAHGWLLVGGEKMSKSKLTGIAPAQIVDHFGSDAFRYYFLRSIQFGQDGSFSWEDMSARYTAELANGLGNLASRATAMIGRYRDGALPAAHDFGPAEQVLIDALARAAEQADAAMGALDFSTGITAVKDFVDLVNGYVTEQEPWVLAKDPALAARLDVVLVTVCEALRGIAVLYNPVMPRAMASLWRRLGADTVLGPIAEQRISGVGEWGVLPAGTPVTKGDALFPRLDEAE